MHRLELPQDVDKELSPLRARWMLNTACDNSDEQLKSLSVLIGSDCNLKPTNQEVSPFGVLNGVFNYRKSPVEVSDHLFEVSDTASRMVVGTGLD